MDAGECTARVTGAGLGGGTGHFSVFLREAGYVVTSYGFQPPDLLALVDPQLDGYVPGHHPVQLPFPDAEFDCVVSIGVLEHVREVGGDEIASVREIRRVLRDSGLFYCYHFPSRYSWIEFLSRCIGRWSHTYRYSRPQVRRIFGAAGVSMGILARYGVLPRNVLRKPRSIRLERSFAFARCFDLADRLLLIPFGLFAQNWMLVAEKTSPAAGEPGGRHGLGSGILAVCDRL